MKVQLDVDSKRALKQLTETMANLIDAIVSLHGSVEANTASLIEISEGGK